MSQGLTFALSRAAAEPNEARFGYRRRLQRIVMRSHSCFTPNRRRGTPTDCRTLSSYNAECTTEPPARRSAKGAGRAATSATINNGWDGDDMPRIKRRKNGAQGLR